MLTTRKTRKASKQARKQPPAMTDEQGVAQVEQVRRRIERLPGLTMGEACFEAYKYYRSLHPDDKYVSIYSFFGVLGRQTRRYGLLDFVDAVVHRHEVKLNRMVVDRVSLRKSDVPSNQNQEAST